jgi:hypothetical protein
MSKFIPFEGPMHSEASEVVHYTHSQVERRIQKEDPGKKGIFN